MDDSLSELAMLARTADAEVVGALTQQVERTLPTYLGAGKLAELEQIHAEIDFNTLICDDELTPVQQRNLERRFAAKQLGAGGEVNDVKVIDRTALILDVFSQHARTREGRLQVELAQAEYLLPRLAGQWSHLERLGGGIGTRGPGETQIETDRRIVARRIQRMKTEIERVRRQREQHRAQRRRSGIPVISLVGYTNAGKSSLLNALSGAGVLARDQLFSTLDPVTRRVRLPGGRQALVTDTVGFIQKLPATVTAAFHATLEELEEASVLLHVVDLSHPNAAEHVGVVEDVLEKLGVQDKPRVLALNKADLLDRALAGTPGAPTDVASHQGTLAVVTSCATGLGIQELMRAVAGMLPLEGAYTGAAAAG